MDLPRISVIVPSLNQGRFLGDALQSLVDQRYPDLELIVMDGGSTDQSVDIIRRFGGAISYWQSQPDGGQSAAINAGVERATGEVVSWLNSDDLLCPNALLTVGKAASLHPGFGLFVGNGFRSDERGQHRIPFSPVPIAINRTALRDGINYLLQPATFYSRRAWIEAGGLSPQLRYCMDWDIAIRLAERERAVAIDAFLAIAREYDDTKTASGGVSRAFEIWQTCRAHSGRELSAGAALHFLEALLQEGVSDHLGVNFHRLLVLARVEAARSLTRLTGRDDGFPSTLDPRDVQVRSLSSEVEENGAGAGLERGAVQQVTKGIASVWKSRRRGMLYQAISGLFVLSSALGLSTPEAALRRLRRIERG